MPPFATLDALSRTMNDYEDFEMEEAASEWRHPFLSRREQLSSHSADIDASRDIALTRPSISPCNHIKGILMHSQDRLFPCFPRLAAASTATIMQVTSLRPD